VSTSRILLLAAAVLLPARVSADQVVMKNGDRLTGTIVKLDEKNNLILQTDYADEVKLQWAAVDAITSTQNLHLTLKDGQTIVGVVNTSDGTVRLRTKETGEVTASKDSIVAIRSDKEEAAYQAELDRLQHPHLLDFWSGFVDLGLSLTRGNSDTLNFSLGGKAARTTARDKISVYANSIWAKQNTAGTSVTTARDTIGGVRGDLNLNARVFAFGFADFENNLLQKLNLRNVLGGGAGYHLWKSDRAAFDLSGGADYQQGYFIGGISQKSAEIVAGEELAYKFSSRSQFDEKVYFFPDLSQTGQYRMTFDATNATKLSNWLNWQITFGDRLVSNPPVAGVKKNDLLLTTGFRVSFGKGLF